MPKEVKTKKITKTKAARRKTGAKKSIKTESKIDLEEVISSIVSETSIAVDGKSAKKSSHLLNLRNPHQEIFVDDQPIIPKPAAKKSEPIRPPKDIPRRKRNTHVGVDFISNKNALRRLSIVGFFQGLFRIFTLPLQFLYSQEESVDPEPLQVQEPQTFGDDTEVEDIFAFQKKPRFIAFKMPPRWKRKLALFITTLLVLVLPLQAYTYYKDLKATKDKILLATNDAINSLKLGEKAATSLDLKDASSKFGDAQTSFILAQNEVNALNTLTTELLKLLPSQNKSVQAGVILLEAGEIAAETGQLLIDSGQNFLEDKDVSDYYQSLIEFEEKLRVAFDNFREIKAKVSTVDPEDLPEEHRATFEKVISDLPTIENGLKNLLRINDGLLTILGHDQWQRYLLVFMNNNELRGTGGFMGSFAMMDLDRGKIKNLEVPGGGTYDVQGQLKEKVISPEPLHLINSRWEFQDANWWPDFPTSAKKIQWFQENSWGPSVDGVVALTATLMEDLLNIFGPIEMPAYDKVITGDNFREEAQNYSALEYDKEENQPKKLIADLAPVLLEKVFSGDKQQLISLFEVIRASLNEKHLMVNFNQESVQNLVVDFGWDGALKNTQGDFLSIVHTNLAGGKTDGVIREAIDHQVDIQEDGSIINTVKLTRHHTGVRGDNIFTGVQNNSYVRFYVPEGSTLLEATGFNKPDAKFFDVVPEEYTIDKDLIAIETNRSFDETSGTDIYNESDKTVFGNWLQLQAGEVQDVVIRYKLPFKLSPEGKDEFFYSLLAQKQHGSLGSTFSSHLNLNDHFTPISKFPEDLPSDGNSVSFNTKLTTDQFYGVTLTNK